MRKEASNTHLWVASVSTVFRNRETEIATGLRSQIQPVVISNEPAHRYPRLTDQVRSQPIRVALDVYRV